MTTSTRGRRIGICGSGISGLALGAILSHQLGDSVTIDILERGDRDRDQGYGLDLDQPSGHEALKRAGCFDRYWEVSRPFSDVWKFFDTRCGQIGCAFIPAFLRDLMPSKLPPRPESNRTALRCLLLDTIAKNGNVAVKFNVNCRTVDARACTPEGARGNVEVDVRDDEGHVIGTYDLLVDATGVHSPLRHYRMNDPSGKHFTGETLIHGAIDEPSPELAALIGEGSCLVIGNGLMFIWQRFGVGRGDNRTAFFYMVWTESEDEVYTKTGIEPTRSREEGIMRDDERLAKLKEFLHRDMGEHVSSKWHAAIDELNRATVRAQLTHGIETSLIDDSNESLRLPMVCIGDAQRNCGLGGGGQEAFMDSIELSELIVATPHNQPIDIDALRAAEKPMLERKTKFATEKLERSKYIKERALKRQSSDADPYVSVPEMLSSMGLGPLWRVGVSIVLTTMRVLWAIEMTFRGHTGSAPPRSSAYAVNKKDM